MSMLTVTVLRPRKYRDLKRSIRPDLLWNFFLKDWLYVHVDLLPSVLYILTHTQVHSHANISSTLRFNQLTHAHPQHMSIYGYFEAFLG